MPRSIRRIAGAVWRHVVPHIARSDLLVICGVALTGALAGGVYGIIHDQVSYSISAEYFTKLKFAQFHYLDVGLGDRVFASSVGFLATACAGLIGGWFLARRLVPHQPRARAYRQIMRGMTCVFACAVTAGVLGFAYGIWRGPSADYSAWQWAFDEFGITDTWSFMRVAYIHNAGYLGAALGLLLALATLRPDP